MTHLEGDASSNLASLDSKSRMLIEDTRNTITTNKLQEEQERGKLETRMLSTIASDNSKRDIRMVITHDIGIFKRGGLPPVKIVHTKTNSPKHFLVSLSKMLYAVRTCN